MSTKKWGKNEVISFYKMPFFDLLSYAYSMHKKKFKNNEVELCALLSIKTGNCPEDCHYCAQSSHNKTDIKSHKLLNLDCIIKQAKLAKKAGATRFCMGAAWHSPPEKEFSKLLEIVKAVKALGLETCITAGSLNKTEAEGLKKAGLNFYNHNLNTSRNYYPKIAATHTFNDRLNTIKLIQETSINTCCGFIIGMGESRDDRIDMLLEFSRLPSPPQSIPINRLVPIDGTPLANTPEIDNFEFIKTVAITRIMLPSSIIRLAAGREKMSEEMQALCFMAGANSIFFGDKLLTSPNSNHKQDIELLKKLGIKPKKHEH